MSKRANLVNLDAMIVRADFAIEATDDSHVERVPSISIRDFTTGGLVGPSLRKPDFQRETNHWSPEQVASLLQCYVDGELIPSVILWQSPSFLFVIDGGHRLSAIKAWIEDDYGDGHISQAFFGYEVSREQKRVADNTRRIVNERVGRWRDLEAALSSGDVPPAARRRTTAVVSRALPIQWVTGDAEKAESSFFRINTKGTPLDEIEELLLRSRTKPIAIAARAVIRAGKGHRYWSSFDAETAGVIEARAQELHDVLFEPELRRPVKTLDLPLGGSKGMRTALEVLIDFMLIASRGQDGKPAQVEDQPVDTDGEGTVEGLKRALRLARRITGNDAASLGLHPAVYFYGPTGRHSGPMFMGTVGLFGRHVANNNGAFFRRFCEVREAIEAVLVENKDLIAAILQKHSSRKRAKQYEQLLGACVEHLAAGGEIDEEWVLSKSGLRGKVMTGIVESVAHRFSDDVKSEVFISTALAHAMKCPICRGYLVPEKSVSYDHVKPERDGGTGEGGNCQLVHPYCNSAIKS